MKILGLSFFYHDSAAVLLVNGMLVAAAEEERFSRRKNDSGFPQNAISFVLKEGRIKASDLDYIVFYEKPFLKFDRIFKTLLTTFPSSPQVFIETIKHLFLDRLWIKALIVKKLKIDENKILFSQHHLSHAISSFLCSPFNKAAIITVDGVGEWATTTIGMGKGNKIKILKEIRFPHSLGLLYSAFTSFLGFAVNEGEYKVMGMAPYGKPKYIDKIKRLVKFFPDSSYKLNMDYFSYHRSLGQSYSQKFIELFGRPRNPQSKFFTRDTGWPIYFGRKPNKAEYQKLALKQEYYADIAASIQAAIEEALIRLANEAYRITGEKNLCLAGGVALNSVANWKILNKTPFQEIFIQPAAGDAGGALGAALFLYHSILKNKRKLIMNHAYYGKQYSLMEIKDFLQKNKLKNQFIKDEDKLLDLISDEIIKGKIIGWFHHRFEWGPRALGARSILADPRRIEMKDIVNTKIKFREPYRPFAPSVLAEKAEEFFRIPEKRKNHYPLNFMLYVVDVRQNKRKLIPAVTHVDGTARPQLVYKESSLRYWKLINAFYQKTGIPVLLNTSFNLKGEPIVNSPADAYNTFSKSQLDLLVLENFIIRKN